MIYPADHFPNTPLWVQDAVQVAVWNCGVTPYKWVVPLEAIGFYESTYNPGAGLAKEVTTPGCPIGMMQEGRNFYQDAWTLKPERFRTKFVGDPVTSLVMAIMHINSELTVSGGYQGIGTPTGSGGLLVDPDHGPGDVLRAWIADPKGFTPEGARSLYKGY